jgi:hypothetical protein
LKRPTDEAISNAEQLFSEGYHEISFHQMTDAAKIFFISYRLERTRAELAERQYLELKNTYWRVSDKETEELLARHESERKEANLE